jgi:hypothetical protein
LSVNNAGGSVKAKKQERFSYLADSGNVDGCEYKGVAEVAIRTRDENNANENQRKPRKNTEEE